MGWTSVAIAVTNKKTAWPDWIRSVRVDCKQTKMPTQPRAYALAHPFTDGKSTHLLSPAEKQHGRHQPGAHASHKGSTVGPKRDNAEHPCIPPDKGSKGTWKEHAESLCLKEAAGGEQISSQVRDQWATQSSSAKTEERLRGKKRI